MGYVEAIAEIVRAERAYDAICEEFIAICERKTAAWQAVQRARDAGKAVITERAAEMEQATR